LQEGEPLACFGTVGSSTSRLSTPRDFGNTLRELCGVWLILESLHREEGKKDGKKKAVKSVDLSDGRKLSADYVVLATGSSYAFPIKAIHDRASTVEERRNDLLDAHKVLEAAPSVLIIGGGTVGVELAAEIVGVWGRAKAVTLITPHNRLLERMPLRAGKLAADWLKRKGVRVILNDRVEDWGGAPREGASLERFGRKWTLRTKQGQELRASLVYPCIGGRPCGEPTKMNIPSAVGSHGEILVDDTFRVDGLLNVFAVGDCAGMPEEKNAFTADLNATAVAANIISLHRGESPSYHPYPRIVCGSDKVPAIAVVSLYKWNGIMQFNSLVISGILAAFVKWFIETLQVYSARGVFGATFLWDLVEVTNLFLARFLFVPKSV
jgi:apoptosis-inducing factor 2